MNPLSADVTQGPLMPRIMEMDILRRTKPDTLLGETSFQCKISPDRIINIPYIPHIPYIPLLAFVQ